MKRYLTIAALLAAIALLNGCSVTEAKSPVAPVHQPVYSTGYITIHSQPEGAMIFALRDYPWEAVGYTPVSLPVRLAEGKTMEWIYLQAVPTGPGQFTQRGQIPTGQLPGSITVLMYNTSQ
jgi:hypothetical protein